MVYKLIVDIFLPCTDTKWKTEKLGMTTVVEICLEIKDENVSGDRNIAVKFLGQKYFFIL